MVLQIKTGMTVEEFDAWVMQPENVDHDFEYIAGEIVEVVSNSYSSEITALMTTYLGMYLLEHKIGRLTAAEGGYIIAGERYIPDVAFVSYSKQPKAKKVVYNPTIPDLVVDVLSPTNEPRTMRIKITNYLSEGVIVWLVNPVDRTIELYHPAEPVAILTENDTLTGGDVLPEFQLPVTAIFPEVEDNSEDATDG